MRSSSCLFSVTSHLERAKYIPIRLLYDERKHLRLLEASLRVSEYTDKIDILAYGNKAKRIHAQVRSLIFRGNGTLTMSRSARSAPLCPASSWPPITASASNS